MSALERFHCIDKLDNPNSIHTFNRIQEEGHAEQIYNHFKTFMNTYVIGILATFDDVDEE